MKTAYVFTGITVFFFVVILAWVGATSDIFHHLPAEDMPTTKQQGPIAKPSTREKKKNCHCCTQMTAKLKEIINASFAEDNTEQKRTEKQSSIVSQAQR